MVGDAHDDNEWNERVIKMDMIMRNGYRYIPLVSLLDCRLKWPITGHVSLSPHDRSPGVSIVNKCRTLVNNDVKTGGYRSAMATHGLGHGTAFFEVLVEAPNVRIGVAQLWAHLDGPVGMDRWGFGVTDSGHIIHDAFKRPFMTVIEPNTIVGILVNIPLELENCYSEEVVFEHCKLPFLQCKLRPIQPTPLPGSYIKVFVNGREVGVAFENFKCSSPLFPMFSVFRQGRVTVNFGPHFVFPPDQEFKPWSDLYND